MFELYGECKHESGNDFQTFSRIKSHLSLKMSLNYSNKFKWGKINSLYSILPVIYFNDFRIFN
jgi:hypothetical protein